MAMKLMYTLNVDDIKKIVEEQGYSDFIEKRDIAQTLFREEYINDVYKSLWIGDDENPRLEDWMTPADYEERIAYCAIIKALQYHCEKNNIKTDCLLVDVSW